jgi:ligand-binding sensor domain-containing protein
MQNRESVKSHSSSIAFVVNKLVLSAFVFFFSIFFESALAQPINPKPVFRQFTVDEGLPSNEVFHVIQDSLGYIWLATANGVSRFDGYTFKNYGIEHGLVETTTHEIFIDYKGRYWFVSNSGRLAYLENGIIRPFKYNFRINDYVSKSRGTVKNSFYVDSLDNVYLSLKSYGGLMITPEGIVKEILPQKYHSNTLIEQHSSGKFLISNTSVKNTFEITFMSGVDTFYYSTRDINAIDRQIFHIMLIQNSKDSHFLTAVGNLFSIDKGKISNPRKFGNEIIWTSLDNDNNLWIAPIEGGVHRFKKGNYYQEKSQFFLDNAIVTSVTKDSEGGYWFSSLSHGLFYCPNIETLIYNKEVGLVSDRISAVFANKEGLLAGNDMGIVTSIKSGVKNDHIIDIPHSKGAPIRFIGIDSTSNKTWIGSTNYLHSLHKGNLKTFYLKDQIGGSYPRQMIESNDGKYWIASSWGIRLFDGNEFIFNSRDLKEFSGLVYTVYQDSLGKVWMGTANGIWQYYNNNFHYLGEKNTLLSHPTNEIEEGPNKSTLMATRGGGLVVETNDTIFNITQSDGLSSNFIHKIFVDKSGIWLATNNGINWIKGDIFNDFTIQIINTSLGLPTNEINNLFIRGNQVYVATTKGLAVFDKRYIFHNQTKPKVNITHFRVNNSERSIKEAFRILSYDQNIISFEFVGLAFKNMGKVNYRYRLNGLDSVWVYTKSTNSNYAGLKKGVYKFEVQAQNSDNIWGNSSFINFAITPPYWQTNWFIIISTIVFTLIIFLIFRFRIISLRRRNELINNVNVYKQQSLRQQMNPHFIFNTLNSIQLYILEKDHISSHKYLTKFAKLMRLILDNSQQTTIPLKDEIEALKLYLELESIRLSGKFEYFINIEDNDLLNCRIPTLLIQPFVENAIWHGIMLKPNQDGWVKINVSNHNGGVMCSIEDNGVGREAAQKVRSKQEVERKSLGFKITAQRIDILNVMYKNTFMINYTDLKSSTGESKGTRVDIQIPCMQSNGMADQ